MELFMTGAKVLALANMCAGLVFVEAVKQSLKNEPVIDDVSEDYADRLERMARWNARRR